MDRIGQTVELDVRPYLLKKLEPFKIIMDTVKELNKEDIFILHATFKPTPLFGLMKTKGYAHKVEKIESDHWVITFVHKKSEHTLEDLEDYQADPESLDDQGCLADSPPSQIHELDNRGLEPPQPMIRTLKKLEEALSGDEVIIHNDRVPVFLIEELNTLGYNYDVEEQSDGSAKIHIHKK
jgi:TusA-related sulfurtransferase